MAQRRLIELAADDPKHPRNEAGRKQFVIDANAVLEALLLEYGVDAAIAALKKHHFKSDSYDSVVRQLHEKALVRAAERKPDAVQQVE